MRDKHGKRVYKGDYILFDADFLGLPEPELLKIRWHSRKYGCVAEKLKGNPTPQCIGYLEHRFERVPKKKVKEELEKRGLWNPTTASTTDTASLNQEVGENQRKEQRKRQRSR